MRCYTLFLLSLQIGCLMLFTQPCSFHYIRAIADEFHNSRMMLLCFSISYIMDRLFIFANGE